LAFDKLQVKKHALLTSDRAFSEVKLKALNKRHIIYRWTYD